MKAEDKQMLLQSFNLKDPVFFQNLPKSLENGDFDNLSVRELKARIAEAGTEVSSRDQAASFCSIAFAIAAM